MDRKGRRSTGSEAASDDGKHPRLNGYTSKFKILCPEMAYYCFDSLLNHLNRQGAPKPQGFPDDSYPLFVTWYTGTGRQKHLRGCIGTFTPLSLYHGLNEYAITSAMRDSRFNPIALNEVPTLQVAVSLLINFEEGKDYLDWEVGVHGIRIEFINEKGQHRSATYLPEVSKEQGWNKTQTIDSLLRKGGYKNHVTAEFRASIRLTRYQSEKLCVPYSDYIKHASSKRKMPNGSA